MTLMLSDSPNGEISKLEHDTRVGMPAATGAPQFPHKMKRGVSALSAEGPEDDHVIQEPAVKRIKNITVTTTTATSATDDATVVVKDDSGNDLVQSCSILRAIKASTPRGAEPASFGLPLGIAPLSVPRPGPSAPGTGTALSVWRTNTPLKHAKYYKETANIVQASSIKEGLSLFVRIPGETRPSDYAADYIPTLCFADEDHTEVVSNIPEQPAVQVCQVKTDSRNLPQDSVELKLRVNQKTCDVDCRMRKFHFCVRIELKSGAHGPAYSEPFISVPKVTRPMKQSQNDDSSGDDEAGPSVLPAARVLSAARLGALPPLVVQDEGRRIELLHNARGILTFLYEGKIMKIRSASAVGLVALRQLLSAKMAALFPSNTAPTVGGHDASTSSDLMSLFYRDPSGFPAEILDEDQLEIALEELADTKYPGTNTNNSNSGGNHGGAAHHTALSNSDHSQQ